MSKHKILIVEDDKFLKKIYEEKFRSDKDYDVITAEDGDTALKLAKQEIPDIILLDLIIPKKTGFEVLTEIKKDVKTKNILVIVLSNLGQEDDINKCISLGANDYIIKSNVKIKQVQEKVATLLKK